MAGCSLLFSLKCDLEQQNYIFTQYDGHMTSVVYLHECHLIAMCICRNVM